VRGHKPDGRGVNRPRWPASVDTRCTVLFMKTKKWQRVLAVGCSHGDKANPDALAAVLKFAERWKPVHRIHLGDAYDTAAFRTGAKGSADEAAGIAPDISAGQKFLRQFRPTVFCIGNHEHRLVKLCGHYNAVIACAADATLRECLQPLKASDCKVIPYTVHGPGWYELGGFKWGHGHVFGENYLRDTAESWGNTVVAHAHRPGVAHGRRSDGATAYGVGTLADIPALEYASGRRSTLAWAAGMVFGEVCGNEAQLCLWEWPQGTTDFRLPI
jgi:hypothetical protein